MPEITMIFSIEEKIFYCCFVFIKFNIKLTILMHSISYINIVYKTSFV